MGLRDRCCLSLEPPKRPASRALRILAPIWLMCASMLLGATGVAVVNPSLWRDEAANARAVLAQPHSTEAQRKSAITTLLRNWRSDIELLQHEQGRDDSVRAHASNALQTLRETLR